jgi:hypothetical protein
MDQSDTEQSRDRISPLEMISIQVQDAEIPIIPAALKAAASRLTTRNRNAADA